MASAWDELNRIDTKTYPGGVRTPAVTYCYDGDTDGLCAGAPAGPIEVGNLTMVTDGSLVTRYHHDPLRRVGASEQVTGEEMYGFGYTYNRAGGLESEIYPSGREVEVCYDKAGRPKSVEDAGSSSYYASDVEYAAHGAMLHLELGNGVTEDYSYNSRLQPASITALDGGTTLLSLANYYCPSQQSSCASNNGNVLSQVLSAPKTAGGLLTLTQTYGYL